MAFGVPPTSLSDLRAIDFAVAFSNTEDLLSEQAEYHDDIIYPNTIAFIFVHLAPLAAFWTGVTMTSVIMAITLYVVRMFGITAGYHRFFSHRSFKTSRAFQFVLAGLAMSSTQKSVLWWAALHRHHHRHSDQEDDVHSPLHRGFYYSHVGWIFDKKNESTRLEEVADLAKYPELRFLDKHQLIPAIVLAIACFLIDGWSGLLIGFFLSTAVLYHGTFFINSLAHVHGSQRYVTGDTSRNNWWLAVITLGEGCTTIITPISAPPVRVSAGMSSIRRTTPSAR